MTVSTIQRSFAAGEIGPSLYGRGDARDYAWGLKTCRNCFVMRHGGVSNRAGSTYIAEVKDSSVRTYLLKFVFNDDQTYILEVGAGYMRFYQEGAQVTVSGVSAWSGATAYVVGDLASRSGVNYYCIQAHTNQQPPNATYWYPLSGSIYEIPTPYAAADLAALKTVQSGDTVTILHPSYAPRELKRTAATTWTLTALTTAPSITAPTGLSVSPGGSGTITYAYKVTAVKEETYEESVPTSAETISSASEATETAPHELTWNSVSGAAEYNVYASRGDNGIFGFIGVASGTTFNDIGFEPDFALTPPVARSLFATSNNYPATGTYYQQRLSMAGSNSEPDKVYSSRTGFFKNFTISSPIQDDDAVTFRLSGKKVQQIRHLLEVGRMIALSAAGEWVVVGDGDGVLRPTAINAKQVGHSGASTVPPIVNGNTIIYVQDMSEIVRDLRIDPETGAILGGSDLTLTAPHLFDDRAIERMDFVRVPDPVTWFVRNDGKLIGLTYVPELDVRAWHRHDTDGSFEDVCVVPEFQTDDAMYVIVKRTINGSTVRYIERFAKRRGQDIYYNVPGDLTESMRINVVMLDSHLTYNGINAGATTLTLSTGAGWTTGDTITITASAAQFVSGDVGKVYVLRNGSAVVRITVTAFTDSTHMNGTPNITVPASLRNTATAVWEKAISVATGLDHLEGATVGILADGESVAQQEVSGGEITLSTPASVIHVGLPFTSDVETLSLDSPQYTIRDKKKLLTSVTLLLHSSRGITVGPDADHLRALPSTIDLTDTEAEARIDSRWKNGSSVFIRQTAPYPMSILGIIPNFELGG
jgi:hypothetical protein